MKKIADLARATVRGWIKSHRKAWEPWVSFIWHMAVILLLARIAW